MLILERPHFRQPSQARLANTPLTRGIVSAVDSSLSSVTDLKRNVWTENGGATPKNFTAQFGQGHTYASASSQYKILGRNICDGEGWFATWFYAADASTTMALMSIGTNGGTARCVFFANLAAGKVSVSLINDAAGAYQADSGNSFTANKWHFAVGRFKAGSTIDVLLQGGTIVSTAVAGTLALPDRTLLGARINTTVGLFLNGGLLNPVFGLGPITDQQMYALARNPWQLYQEQTQLIVPGEVAGGGIVGPLIGAGHLLNGGPLIGGRLIA